MSYLILPRFSTSHSPSFCVRHWRRVFLRRMCRPPCGSSPNRTAWSSHSFAYWTWVRHLHPIYLVERPNRATGRDSCWLHRYADIQVWMARPPSHCTIWKWYEVRARSCTTVMGSRETRNTRRRSAETPSFGLGYPFVLYFLCKHRCSKCYIDSPRPVSWILMEKHRMRTWILSWYPRSLCCTKVWYAN